MHDHLDEGYGADADGLEVVGVFGPGLIVVGLLLGVVIVVVEGIANGINKLYAIVEFCCRKLVLASYLSIYLVGEAGAVGDGVVVCIAHINLIPCHRQPRAETEISLCTLSLIGLHVPNRFRLDSPALLLSDCRARAG